MGARSITGALFGVLVYTQRKEKENTMMPESLQNLEAQRSRILREFSTLGDLRPGSISAVVRRCGKPTCHCAQPGDAGHDPQIRFTRKVSGKTVAESFPSPDAFRKVQTELGEYHRFQQLSNDLVGVNEKICRHRRVGPDSSAWTAEEKKRLLRFIRKSRAR